MSKLVHGALKAAVVVTSQRCEYFDAYDVSFYVGLLYGVDVSRVTASGAIYSSQRAGIIVREAWGLYRAA